MLFHPRAGAGAIEKLLVAQIQQQLAPPSTSVQSWPARSVQFTSAAYSHSIPVHTSPLTRPRLLEGNPEVSGSPAHDR